MGSNVDRQFAFWQELMKINNIDIQQSGLWSPLRPFNSETYNKFEKTRNNNRGVDTLDYRNNLCYEYDTLTFDGRTPQQFIFTAQPLSENWNVGSKRSTFRYFVGVILPKLSPSLAVKFSVCSRREPCQAAGSVYTFGPRSRVRRGR